MPLDWQVDENGMPKTLKLNASATEKLEVFRELLASIEHLCRKHTFDIEQKKNIGTFKII